MIDQHVDADEEMENDFGDITDENVSEDDIDDTLTKEKEDFQKFIKKISRPS